MAAVIPLNPAPITTILRGLASSMHASLSLKLEAYDAKEFPPRKSPGLSSAFRYWVSSEQKSGLDTLSEVRVDGLDGIVGSVCRVIIGFSLDLSLNGTGSTSPMMW